jgi:hypothetical protein
MTTARSRRNAISYASLPTETVCEHHRRHHEADAGDDLADALLGDALRVVPRKYPPQRWRSSSVLGSVDQSGENEIECRDLIDD